MLRHCCRRDICSKICVFCFGLLVGILVSISISSFFRTENATNATVVMTTGAQTGDHVTEETTERTTSLTTRMETSFEGIAEKRNKNETLDRKMETLVVSTEAPNSGNETTIGAQEENGRNETFDLTTLSSIPSEMLTTNDVMNDDTINVSKSFLNCSANEFRCGNGSACVSRERRCDGLWDCAGGEDEEECDSRVCGESEFKCENNKQCLEGRQVCDWERDCDDGSDERDCVNREKCESLGKFFCDSGLCIDSNLKCDSVDDCLNGTDERACDDACSAFRCDNSACVERRRVCDDVNDCGDNSDELSCLKSDEKGFVFRNRNDTWFPLCVDNGFGDGDANAICRRFGRAAVLNFTLVSNESCVSNESSVSVFCRHFACETGESVPKALRVSDGRHECWAHAVAAHWLLTSARCLTTLGNNVSDISVDNATTVERMHTHFRFSHFRSPRLPDFDFAFLRVRAPLPRVTCLPSHSIDTSITCFAAETAFRVLESGVCNARQHFAGALTPRHFCAERARGHCVAIGRPLMCLSSASAWYLSGFANYEYGCGGAGSGGHVTRHPTVFSNAFSIKALTERVVGFRDYLTFDSKLFQ